MSTPKAPGKASKFFNLVLPKRVVWAIWGILIFTGFNFFRGCNTNKEDSRNRKAVVANTAQIDSLATTFADKTLSPEEIEIMFEIEGLKISKRMLYDNNAIVRTKVRPDDRMNEYDIEIEALENKLKQLK